MYALNGSLYGVETIAITEETLKKMEILQNQMGSWILEANRGTAIEAIRGELGWESIRTTIYKRKLNYINRVRKLPEENWTFKVYSNLISNGIDTKLLKEIRKINSGLSNEYEIADLERNGVIDWEKGVEGKRSLIL